jgi:peptidoglycan/xylan/chitin deacetylase (PgdA/CDA1 family)
VSVYAHRGPLVRLAYLGVAAAWWLFTAAGRSGGRRVLTLCYHGVRPDQAARFRRQLKIATAVAGWGNVRVTFDDAYANLLGAALPAVAELRIPATVFVVTGNLGDRPRWPIAPDHPLAREVTMSAEQIRETAARDRWITWGAHGVTHRRLPALPDGEARDELAESRAQLEELVNRPVEDFAFPYGDWSHRLIRQAFDCGFRRVHVFDSIGDGAARAAGVGEGAEVVVRMEMSPDAWPLELYLTAAGGYGWLPRWRSIIGRRRRNGSKGA